MNLSLFFVRCDGLEDSEHHDLDLLVWAATADEAIQHWRNYYDLPADTDPYTVGSVPLEQRAGPISWSVILSDLAHV